MLDAYFFPLCIFYKVCVLVYMYLWAIMYNLLMLIIVFHTEIGFYTPLVWPNYVSMQMKIAKQGVTALSLILTLLTLTHLT